MTTISRQEARDRGFTIDDHIYPPFAYKGPRFAPTEKAPTYTCLEEAQRQLLTKLVEQMEAIGVGRKPVDGFAAIGLLERVHPILKASL